MSQVFFENLCSHDEFVNMSPDERKKYFDEVIYGDDKPHKILAEISKIGRNVLSIEPLYFLTTDDRAIEFRICQDSESASWHIGTGAKSNGVDNIQAYCGEHNFHEGDTIICILSVQTSEYEIQKGNYLTFYLSSIERFDFSEIENVYTKWGITYEPKEIYSIRDDETEELSTIISLDFYNKLLQTAEEIVSARDAALDARKSQADAEIAEKYSELEKRTAEVNAKISEKYSELQSLREKIFYAERELENFNDELSKMKKFFGIDDEEKVEEKISVEFHEETNFDCYIFYWQQHLAQCHGGLTYRREVLESVYWGLHTDQLILLTGSPGTGKTSLVRALPECFGWENSAIIPVQANWTDKSDLLGYYNPLEKNYMSTPFLDALLKFCRKAEKNSKDVFIICLDEMNLAHVEHYFAEFLSVLQSDEREIRLYGDELRRDIYRELKYNAMIFSEDDTEINFDEQRFMKMNLDERKYYLQLCRMANMFFKYPATFKIPKNIKFFGTLNQDATTLDISPKVIDRSFVIRVEKSDDVELEPLFDYSGKLNFNQSFSDGLLEDDADYYGYEFLRNVEQSKISLSQRVQEKIKKLSLGEQFKDFWDIVVASFVLPKIRFDAKTDKEKISALKNLCEKYPYSKEILEKYMTSPDGKEIDYWRA